MTAAAHLAAGESLTDDQLVDRVTGGDTPLFELLMRRHNQRVYRAVRSVLADPAEAEDAMQAAWLAAFAHLRGFDKRSRFSTWLLRIAVNEALQRREKGLKLVPKEDVVPLVPSDALDPEARAGARELARVLEGEIDALPDLYRPVFVMRELEGLDTAETAAALGITEDAVKMRLHRARAVLRAGIDEKLGAASREAYSFDGERCERITRAVMARVL